MEWPLTSFQHRLEAHDKQYLHLLAFLGMCMYRERIEVTSKHNLLRRGAESEWGHRPLGDCGSMRLWVDYLVRAVLSLLL